MPFRGSACACLSRRRFLRAAGAVAGAGLFLPRPALAGSADALVLTCMDYRLIDEALNYFNGRGLKNKYDHIVLAGASAGALGKLGAEWSATFWKHVETAIQLHHVSELIVVDHRDCGAFKIVYGAEPIAHQGRETALHRTLLHQLRAEVGAKFPKLRTQLLLMALDGSVEDLSAVAEEAPAAAVSHDAGGDAHGAASGH
jgi:hypothetical protein